MLKNYVNAFDCRDEVVTGNNCANAGTVYPPETPSQLTQGMHKQIS